MAKNEQKPDHREVYLEAIGMIVSGAEKLLAVAGDEDDKGGYLSNEDGPYVKTSVPIFCLKMASGIYWKTKADLGLSDEDDCGDPTCGEHSGQNGVRPAGILGALFGGPGILGALFGGPGLFGVPMAGAGASPAGVEADDPAVFAMVSQMSPQERAKLRDMLAAGAAKPAEEEGDLFPPAPPPSQQEPPYAKQDNG